MTDHSNIMTDDSNIIEINQLLFKDTDIMAVKFLEK
jgi:hypothetical protein